MTPDPTAPIASATSAGIGALIVAEMGFPPSLLAVSFAAATIGLLFAPPGRTRWHDLAIFVAAVFCGAWIGTSLAPVLAARVPELAHPAKLATIIVGVLFHPLANVAAKRLLPGLSDKIAAPKADQTNGAPQ